MTARVWEHLPELRNEDSENATFASFMDTFKTKAFNTLNVRQHRIDFKLGSKKYGKLNKYRWLDKNWNLLLEKGIIKTAWDITRLEYFATDERYHYHFHHLCNRWEHTDVFEYFIDKLQIRTLDDFIQVFTWKLGNSIKFFFIDMWYWYNIEVFDYVIENFFAANTADDFLKILEADWSGLSYDLAWSLQISNLENLKYFLKKFNIDDISMLHLFRWKNRKEIKLFKEIGLMLTGLETRHITYVFNNWWNSVRYLIDMCTNKEEFLPVTNDHFDDPVMKRFLDMWGYLEDIENLKESFQISWNDYRLFIKGIVKNQKAPQALHVMLSNWFVLENKLFFRELIDNIDYFSENIVWLYSLYEEGFLEKDQDTDILKDLYHKNWGFITLKLSKAYLLAGDESERAAVIKMFLDWQEDVLSSNEIKVEEYDLSILAEVIYLSYRPIGFSITDIEEMIKSERISDLTAQLAEINFEKDWYKISFQWVLRWNYQKWSDKEQRKADKKLQDIDTILTKKNEDDVFTPMNKKQTVWKTIMRFFAVEWDFMTNAGILQQFYGKNRDDRLIDYREAFQWEGFEKVIKLEEIFSVITHDSFDLVVDELVEKSITDETFEKIKEYFLKLHGKEYQKVRDVLNCNLDIQEKKKWIVKWRLQKYGKQVCGFLKGEKKKYEISEWDNLDWKCYVSKNVGSFYAKAWVGLCTSRNMALWKEKRHVHLNIALWNMIVWNVMLYFEDDRDYFVVRWFNARADFIKDVSKERFINEIIEVLKKIAWSNWYNKIYIPVQDSWHALSNNGALAKIVSSISNKNKSKKEYKINDNPLIVSEKTEKEPIKKDLYLLTEVEENG